MSLSLNRSRRCAAVCDVPSILHWEKIQEAFPEAKIIITHRFVRLLVNPVCRDT